jgi:hypothetical protein
LDGDVLQWYREQANADGREKIKRSSTPRSESIATGFSGGNTWFHFSARHSGLPNDDRHGPGRLLAQALILVGSAANLRIRV